jgi:hypothetical protein
LQDAAPFLAAVEEDNDVALTDADSPYLRALAERLAMNPEMRTDGE